MAVIGSLGRDLPEVKSSVNQYISAYINDNHEGCMSRVLLACLLWVPLGSSVAQTFACQYVAAAGLKWENGSWVTKTFAEGSPFFIGLNSDGKTIDTKTITRLVTSPKCAGDLWISCYGIAGEFLYFSPSAGKGAYALTIGSIVDDSRPKDTLSVSPFICQKM